MKFHPHIRFALVAAVTAVGILCVGWWGLWSLAAAQYRHVIDGWIEAGRAQGYQISYDTPRLFGFPRHIVLRFTNVQWKNTNNIIFHADDIDIAALPWRWDVFDAKFKHHVQIAAPTDADGHALILGGEDGRAHVELDKEGYWLFSRVSLANASFGETPDYVATADMLKASAARPDVPPKDNKEAGLTLSGEAENVTLPPAIASPFGPQMKDFAMDVKIMGDVPDFRKRASVTLWNKVSGVAEFNRLHMEWGPLQMTARGTMGFDDELQPEGAFSSAIANQDAVLKALMDHGYIPQHEEAMLHSALGLFAKPSSLDHTPGIEIPITVQLGGLFFGPVQIFNFPAIEWPQDAAQNPAPATPPAAETAPVAAPPAPVIPTAPDTAPASPAGSAP